MLYHQEVTRYSVRYYAGGKEEMGKWGGYKAVIHFFSDNDYFIGTAYFYRDPGLIPETDDMNSETKEISLHYRLDDFPQILDILRNEKPVYLWYHTYWNYAAITTSEEPPGEGE